MLDYQYLRERRLDMFQLLKEVQLPRYAYGAEYDKIFDERLSIVQEIVRINSLLGEYDKEGKE